MEKDRARQELRALLADPAAGFAALSGDEFFAALKQACQDGTANPALIADCERRITSREAGPRELHQMLFAASDRHAWAGVRTLALAAAGQVPGTAVAVVGLEAQRLGVAPMQVTESAADGGFTATASLERDGARVEGKAGYGGSKKTARQAAALSLLAALTGLAVPADDDPPAAPRDFPDDPGLRPADLESWLDYEVARPSPDPELATAVRPGKLTTRSVYLLLFEAEPRGWASARAAAWEALVSTPMMAGGVLSMYSQARGWPTARYIETGERSALAFLPAPDGLVVGAPSRAATAKAARAGAALALLRDLDSSRTVTNQGFRTDHGRPQSRHRSQRAGADRCRLGPVLRARRQRPAARAGVHLHGQLRARDGKLHMRRRGPHQERGEDGGRRRAAGPDHRTGTVRRRAARQGGGSGGTQRAGHLRAAAAGRLRAGLP